MIVIKNNIEEQFENYLWSRPQNQLSGCQLLIIGGSKYHFQNLSLALTTAKDSTTARTRLFLPDEIKKFSGPIAEAIFAPSNNSGGFSKDSLNLLLSTSSSVDAVVLIGEMDKGSENSILLESFLKKYNGILIVANDSYDVLLNLREINMRAETALYVDYKYLQKNWSKFSDQKPILSTDPISLFFEKLNSITVQSPISITTEYNDQIVTSIADTIITQPNNYGTNWMTMLSVKSAILWGEQPIKQKEALACSYVI